MSKDALESQASKERIEGPQLRQAIMRFFYVVNSFWPDEGIGVLTLLDNLYAEEQIVESFVQQLVAGGLVKPKRGFFRHGENREPEGRKHWVMSASPEAVRQIREELTTAEPPTGAILRAFISYSTKDKVLAGKIKTCLEKHGVSVFLAHEDLEISDEWMDEIIEELKACHVFIPLLTDNYRGSDWTDQEAGYALAFDKKVCPLKVPHNPHGFIRRKQGAPLDVSDVAPACEKIIKVIREDEKLGPLLQRAEAHKTG